MWSPSLLMQFEQVDGWEVSGRAWSYGPVRVAVPVSTDLTALRWDMLFHEYQSGGRMYVDDVPPPADGGTGAGGGSGGGTGGTGSGAGSGDAGGDAATNAARDAASTCGYKLKLQDERACPNHGRLAGDGGYHAVWVEPEAAAKRRLALRLLAHLDRSSELPQF